MATGSLEFNPTQLMAQVRQRLVEQSVAAMQALQPKVLDALIELMDQGAAGRDMQLRRDAWMLYQSAKGKWVDGTIKVWQQTLTVPVTQKSGCNSFKGLALELESTESVENKILASKLALSLMEKAAHDINGLRKRLKFLGSGRALVDTDIVHPEVLLLPVVEQWEASGMPRQAWPLVSQVVQKHLNEYLQKAYEQCNALLTDQGVTFNIEEANPMPTHVDDYEAPEPAMQAFPTPVQNHRGRNGSATGVEGVRRMGDPAWRHGRAQSILQQVGHLLSGVFLGAPARGAAPVVGSAGFGVDASAGGMQPAAGVAPAAGALAGYAGPSVPLMVALAQQPQLSQAHFVTSEGGARVVSQVAHELRQQSAELKGKAENDHEKAIIELVALMFQSILQEDRLPSGVRVWFARLQIPVLRVALAAPDFFNKLDHPARKLIDHMGSCVLGFDSSGISTQELEGEIKRVVQMIEQYPDTGERIYRRVYEEFQTFLKSHLAKKPTAQKLLGVAEQLEQKETLAIQYTIELRNQLKDMPVREEIRNFLFKVWTEVLAVSSVRRGKQDEETVMLRKSATALIWAASAKPSRVERAKVIDHLPELLQSLRTGMSLLGLARAAQDAHLKIISNTLADAFMSKTEAIADEQIQALGNRLAELDDFVDENNTQELPLDSDNIEELLGVETTDLDVVSQGAGSASPEMLEWAHELTLGSWFTLTYRGVAGQVQFVWRSPLGHMHLFANTLGHSYLFQTARLAVCLQSGELDPQEDESLMTRAASNALDQIQVNPERLLG